MSMDIQEARRFLERREKERQTRLRERLRHAQRDAREIVDLLIREYQPRRIFQWGSLVQEEHFREWSDIDLAVEGHFDAETFFRSENSATLTLISEIEKARAVQERLDRFYRDYLGIDFVQKKYEQAQPLVNRNLDAFLAFLRKLGG